MKKSLSFQENDLIFVKFNFIISWQKLRMIKRMIGAVAIGLLWNWSAMPQCMAGGAKKALHSGAVILNAAFRLA